MIPFGELTNPKGAMKITGRHYTHLTKAQRSVLYLMHKNGHGFREIGRALNRHHTTISRELKRNGYLVEVANKLAGALDMTENAQSLANERKMIARKKCKLDANPDLRSFIIKEIKDCGQSPRGACHKVREQFANTHLCHGTIYNYFSNPLKRMTYLQESYRYRGRKFRRHLTRIVKRLTKKGNPKKKNISEMRSFELCPLRFGHLQIDCVVSCKNGSGEAILSIVDVYTHYVWFFKIKDLKSETILATLRGFIGTFKPGMIKTILTDNGSEFEHLYELEAKFSGLKTYYCDPYSPDQRGLNEYSNREFRWYFSKGTDFGDIAYEDIWKSVDQINNRNRDCLKGKTAKQMLEQALRAGRSPIVLVDSKRSWEWNPCMVDLSSLRDKNQVKYQDWQRSEAGLYFPQNSILSLPLQGL